MAVKMYGPAFTPEGEMVEREVPEADVTAFENSGYKKGALPSGLAPVPRPELAEKAEAEKSLDGMTKAELLAEAEGRGVEVSASSTKADIIDALEAGQ